jgi:hypothetical protein
MEATRRNRIPALALAAFAACVLVGAAAHVRADTVLTFNYTPAPRAQVAIWIEDASGKFLATVALTEAVAYRGIGNRPGASEMNSGYRWPYGRREGVLPIWAHRRASAPGAKLFPRVIFQSRVEGLASRTTSDQSLDGYYCLQFDMNKSTRDQLDAVSCATPFSSDKGRYMTAADVANGYAEPFESHPGQAGVMQPLPLQSYYPPRMDVTRCAMSGQCFDTADVDHYAADARAVLPEIDAITIATPPGDSAQSLLFSVPSDWPHGEYAAFIEVNTEGDYNDHWNDTTYPTPKTPSDDWDYYALNYGYAYRGQPSLVWKVSFQLDGSSAVSASTALPSGRSSWNHWDPQYGQIEGMTTDKADPAGVSVDVAGSGVARLRADESGARFSVSSVDLPPGTVKPTKPPRAGNDAGVPMAGDTAPPPPAAGSNGMTAMAGSGGSNVPPSSGSTDAGGNPTSIPNDDGSAVADDSVGPVDELTLSPDPNHLESWRWVRIHLRAARSDLPLHAYEVRIARDPITDESSFIRAGRQAKGATESKEGATLLTLPASVPAGEVIEATIGDLEAETHYYVGVRATDIANRQGPLRIAEVTTSKREFATVTPCFIATAAYGSPLASEVGALRQLRDRYLLSQIVGRGFVAAYYDVGGRLASWLAPHPQLRAAVRVLLRPLVTLANSLD